MTMRVATWNLERKAPDSARGAEAIDYLFGLSSDVMAISEARTVFPTRGGHTFWCEPPQGAGFAGDERKILIWSKQPWSDVDRVGVEGLDQTRFISATTNTPLGPVRVLGVCVPWHMAEVTYHMGVKHKPWELHLLYLKVLRDLIASSDVPTIVAGDFNQQIPRVKYGHRAAAEAIASTFEPMTIVTEGQIDGTSRPGIDHIAISSHLSADSVWGWPHDVGGRALTDHDGAAADISLVT